MPLARFALGWAHDGGATSAANEAYDNGTISAASGALSAARISLRVWHTTTARLLLRASPADGTERHDLCRVRARDDGMKTAAETGGETFGEKGRQREDFAAARCCGTAKATAGQHYGAGRGATSHQAALESLNATLREELARSHKEPKDAHAAQVVDYQSRLEALESAPPR